MGFPIHSTGVLYTQEAYMAKEVKSFVTVNKTEGMTGTVLFLSWVGALVYFINQASGFWEVVLAFLKSLVWPALVLYEVLEQLQL